MRGRAGSALTLWILFSAIVCARRRQEGRGRREGAARGTICEGRGGGGGARRWRLRGEGTGRDEASGGAGGDRGPPGRRGRGLAGVGRWRPRAQRCRSSSVPSAAAALCAASAPSAADHSAAPPPPLPPGTAPVPGAETAPWRGGEGRERPGQERREEEEEREGEERAGSCGDYLSCRPPCRTLQKGEGERAEGYGGGVRARAREAATAARDATARSLARRRDGEKSRPSRARD